MSSSSLGKEQAYCHQPLTAQRIQTTTASGNRNPSIFPFHLFLRGGLAVFTHPARRILIPQPGSAPAPSGHAGQKHVFPHHKPVPAPTLKGVLHCLPPDPLLLSSHHTSVFTSLFSASYESSRTGNCLPPSSMPGSEHKTNKDLLRGVPWSPSS